MLKSEIIYKQIGETPLEALERFRRSQIEDLADSDIELQRRWQEVPMTYAGRLDPLAEGELLIPIGEECRNKDKYLGLDKEYEVEVLFGIETDTHDCLGLISRVDPNLKTTPASNILDQVSIDLMKYVGAFEQSYPAYSSKTVRGKQLHELARADELPEEMPTKKVEIYSIEDLGMRNISGNEIAMQAIENIKKVTGDFRQKEILSGWNDFLKKYSGESFHILKIRVKCSSGTYMRSLADRMGKDAGCGAIALSIKRTKIFFHKV